MPRTFETTVYTFEELEPEAQGRALDHARRVDWRGSDWDDEWRESLSAAARALGFQVEDWSVDASSGHCRVSLSEDVSEMHGPRAWKWAMREWAPLIASACPFTGYCGDESFLDPLRAFLKLPETGKTLGELLDDCASSWARGWSSDIASQFSDDYIRDELTVNEREFLEDGTPA